MERAHSLPCISHVRSAGSLYAFDHYDSTEFPDNSVRVTASRWLHDLQRRLATMARAYGPYDWASLFLPCLSWLRGYSISESLAADVTAGISVAFMVVPQGMSYAVLAGLPPVFGLYGAFVPVFTYALFGSSPHLAVGPTAVNTLLLGHSLHHMLPEMDAQTAENGTVQLQYNQAAVQLAFLVGLLYLAVGVLRLGFLANFLSHSVISGFSTGAALLIGLTQLKYLLGVSIRHTSTALETAVELLEHIGDTKWREVVMCSTWLLLLLAMKGTARRVPWLACLRALGPLVVCVLSILTVVCGRLDERGLVQVVGSVTTGLPRLTARSLYPVVAPRQQASAALLLFLVGFMESVSISKALARKHRYRIDVPQEVVALGFANILGSMFSAFPATGSFSRSSVSADVGARTGVQGVVTGIVVTLVLLFITPVFERVPYNALGAIVLSSVSGLVEWGEAAFLLRVNVSDGLVWLAAFLGTALAGVEVGISLAIGLAVVLVIYQSAFPHTAVLGRLPQTDVYRSRLQYPAAEEHPHVLVVRIDAPIYFANVDWIQGCIDRYLDAAEATQGPVVFLVLDLGPVPFIDAAGVHALGERIEMLRAEARQLVLSNPCAKVQQQLLRADLVQRVGRSWIFVNTSDAVNACLAAVRDQVADERPLNETEEHGLDSYLVAVQSADLDDLLKPQ